MTRSGTGKYLFNPDDLEQIYLDQENYYSLLVDRANKILVLEVMITSIGWYSMYFWLSAEEYRLFKEDKRAFDRLARGYAIDKGQRFFTHRLLSDGDQHQGEEPVPIEGL